MSLMPQPAYSSVQSHNLHSNCFSYSYSWWGPIYVPVYAPISLSVSIAANRCKVKLSANTRWNICSAKELRTKYGTLRITGCGTTSSAEKRTQLPILLPVAYTLPVSSFDPPPVIEQLRACLSMPLYASLCLSTPLYEYSLLYLLLPRSVIWRVISCCLSLRLPRSLPLCPSASLMSE